MIYFPAPYPDEILYSILARYAVRNDVLSSETIRRELFGRNLVYSNIDLPLGIGALTNNLPVCTKINSESLIYNHTLFPLYTAFLPVENVNLIYDGMISSNGNQIYIKSGLATSTIKKNEYLRFCKKCYDEDMELYGESYFRRQHQIPGVIVCKKHVCFLQDSAISNGADTKKAFITANYRTCKSGKDCFEKFAENENLNINEETMKNLKHDTLMKSLALCENIEFILNHKLKSQTNTFFINKYIDVLRGHGLTNSAGFTYPDKIQSQFFNYYGENFLKITQSLNDKDDRCNWLYLFIRKNKSIRHPLRHLLFCMFLGIGLESLFNKEVVGEGRIISKMNYEPRRKKEDVRQRYLNLIRDNPEATRSDLQTIDKGTYIWLIRYDKDWYHQVAPKRKKMIVPKDKKSWEDIDREAVSAVEEALKFIKGYKEKPIRITKTYILRIIADNVKVQSLNKMPLTRHRIILAVESIEQYRERKMIWAIRSLLAENENLTMWKVIRRMGIGVNISVELKEKVVRNIDNILSKMS